MVYMLIRKCNQVKYIYIYSLLLMKLNRGLQWLSEFLDHVGQWLLKWGPQAHSWGSVGFIDKLHTM